MAQKKVVLGNNNTLDLSPRTQILANIGPKTAKAVYGLAKSLEEFTLLRPEDVFTALSKEMETGWSDSQASLVVSAVKERIKSGSLVDTTALVQWIRVHPGDPYGVRDCILVDPPEGIDILKVLSRAGSQKLVFLANWLIAQREIVLKKFVGEDAENRILQRETQTHPLSMVHPNIIETHILQNRQGEYFLAERRLPLVLSDGWKSNGLQEAANLLRDIANAIAFLSEQKLVHGDIKPDNIGFEAGRYILLDFGICRPQDAFEADVTPTGSLRTRSPELLMKESHHSIASDIWALGATVFNAITGHFPLFNLSESLPRVSSPEKRAKFEEVLCNRVQNEWSQRLDLSVVPEALRPLLELTLAREPQSRIKAVKLVHEAEQNLSAVLRFREGESSFSPSQEIEQLSRYLPDERTLTFMPESQRRDLHARLIELRASKGLTAEKEKELKSIESRL